MAIFDNNLAREAQESTFQNAVYLDREGRVVSRKDPSVMTKISRQEALRRGLIPLDSPPVADEAPAETPEAATRAITADSVENRAITPKAAQKRQRK